MCKNGIKFFLGMVIIVFALICVPGIEAALNPVTATFVDGANGANPGNISLIEEHTFGVPGVQIGWAYQFNGDPNVLRVNIVNTSTHMMTDTVLIFEESGHTWQADVLLPTWDGTVGSNAAYWFGNIAPSTSAFLDIGIISTINYSPKPLAYSSLGLDSGGLGSGSNVSVAHAVVPEPISSVLFLSGGALLGIRRYVKKRNIS